MAKKIYDIKPPKIVKKIEDDIKSFIDGDKKNHIKKEPERK